MVRETAATILVVDDERGVRRSFQMVLKNDYHTFLAETGEEAVEIFKMNSIDLILLDIRLRDMDGLDLLKTLKEMDHNTEVILVTAVNDIRTAVRAIKLGAYEYIIKPFVVDDVLEVIHRALEKRTLFSEVTYLRQELQRYHAFEKMVGEDEKMIYIFDLISTIAQSEGTVLIQGESGTGKELVARAIHNLSLRKDGPFVVINCAAIPPTLMESEIFGYNQGAFTGALKTTIGKMEIANKGTVFFDDIDSLDLNMQAKLLRIIQEKELQRLGNNKVIKIDVRFLAGSNKDLKGLMAKERFRDDLFYRLNVFPIMLPPLRKRKGDIPLLLNHFLGLYSKKNGKIPEVFSKRAGNALMKYDWPGNVRELQNLVERLSTVVKKPVIELEDITPLSVMKSEIKGMKLKEALDVFEKQYIHEILESVHGNRRRASELLGVHRNTLLRKLY